MSDNVQGQTPLTLGTTPVQTGTTPDKLVKPKLMEIFKVGLTRTQAEQHSAEALHMFDTYNKADASGNKDDVIDEAEYNDYLNNTTGQEEEHENEIRTGKSGTRTAENNVYVVKKGDTLSKIANDFGIDLTELYKLNEETIGKNINKIQIGQELVLTKEQATKIQLQQKLETLEIPDGIKETISQALGKDISNLSNKEMLEAMAKMNVGELTNVLTEVLSKIDKEDIGNLRAQLALGDGDDTAVMRSFILQMSSADGAKEVMSSLSDIIGEDCTKLTLQELVTKINGLPKENRSDIFKKFAHSFVDKDISLKGLEDGATSESFYAYLGIDEATVTGKDGARSLADAIIKQRARDLDENDENSLYRQRLAKLRAGEFTDKQKQTLLSRNPNIDLNNVPDSLLQNMARQSVHDAYLKAITETDIDLGIVKGHIRELEAHYQAYKMADVEAEAREAGCDTSILAKTGALIIQDESVSAEDKESLANTLVECDLGVDALSDEDFAVYTAVIANHADSAHIEEYINQNSDRADIIKDVVNILINNTSDPDKINQYNNILTTVDRITGQSDGADTSGTVLTGETARVADIRARNEEYNAERGLTTTGSHETQAAKHSAHRISMELDIPEQIRYNPDRIRRLVQDYNNSFANFDSLPKEDQEKLKLYLAGAPTHALVTMIVSGNSNTQKFIMDYITTELISRTLNADDHQNLITQIKDRLSALIMSRVQAGTLKPEQMTETERVIYEYAQQNA